MNKYKEAKKWINKIKSHPNWSMCNIEPALSQLSELVEKATSKKGVWIADNFGDKTLSCPNCKKPIINVWSKRDYKPHYCHYYGQALDWGCR